MCSNNERTNVFNWSSTVHIFCRATHSQAESKSKSKRDNNYPSSKKQYCDKGRSNYTITMARMTMMTYHNQFPIYVLFLALAISMTIMEVVESYQMMMITTTSPLLLSHHRHRRYRHRSSSTLVPSLTLPP